MGVTTHKKECEMVLPINSGEWLSLYNMSIKIGEKLKRTPFIRIDLYLHNGSAYFGEFCKTPYGGKVYSDSWLSKFDNWM